MARVLARFPAKEKGLRGSGMFIMQAQGLEGLSSGTRVAKKKQVATPINQAAPPTRVLVRVPLARARVSRGERGLFVPISKRDVLLVS